MALLAATVLVAAGVPALGAGTSNPPAATGLTLVQYAETNAPPLPWDAHSLSGTTQELPITGSPAAAADATGGTRDQRDAAHVSAPIVGHCAATRATRSAVIALRSW